LCLNSGKTHRTTTEARFFVGRGCHPTPPKKRGEEMGTNRESANVKGRRGRIRGGVPKP